MSKFHINPETGRAGQCHAKSPESCKFSIEAGTVVAHYDSKESAKESYEKMNQHKTTETITKKPKVKKTPTLSENREALSKIYKAIEGMNNNIRIKTNKISSLIDSLSLKMPTAERDRIYDEVKNYKEEILKINEKREELLNKGKDLTEAVRKQEVQENLDTYYSPVYEGGPCGGARAC